MRIFVDVDGTLTKQQKARSVFKDDCDLWPEMIEKVKRLVEDGHEVVIWSGDTEYAKRVASRLGIKAVACVGKPELIVDNEKDRWSRRLANRMVTPEEFLAKDIPKG